MATVGTLNINFATNVATLISDMQKAARGVKKSSDDMTRGLRQVQGMVRSTIAAFAGFAGFRMARSAIKDLGDLADAADKAGVSAERLQIFRLLGEDVGVGAAVADAALSDFTKRVGQAQAGTGKLLDVLKDYNIALKDSNGNARSAGSIMGDLSNVIAGTADAQEQLRIAGAMGMEDFVAGLRNGEAGLASFEDRVRAAGLVIDDELVKKADQFDKAWSMALMSVSVQFKSLTVQFVDQVRDIWIAAEGAAERLAFARAHPWQSRQSDLSAASGPGALHVGQYAAAVRSGQDFYGIMGINRPAPPATGGPGAGKATEDMIKNAEKEKKKIDDVVESLKFKTEQLGRTAEQQAIFNELNAAGVTLMSKEGQEIAGLVNRFQEMKSVQDQVTRAAQEMQGAFTSALESIVINGGSAREAIHGLLQDMQRMVLRAATNSIFESITGSIFGGLTGGGGGVPIPGHKPPIPSFAVGTPYVPDDMLANIHKGERIMTAEENAAYSRGAGGGGPGGDTYYIDARGADQAAVARLEQTIKQLNGSIERRAISAVGNQFVRSSTYLRR